MPATHQLLNELGTVYLKYKEYNKAIDRFKKCIELKPDDSDAYLNLSKAYILSHQFHAEAQAIFEKALQYEPTHPLITKILFRAYLNAERDDENAIQIYLRSLRTEPDNFQNHLKKLIQLSLTKDNEKLAHGLITAFSDDLNRLHLIVTKFVEHCWKKQAFGLAANFLKKMITLNDDIYFQRLMLLNIDKAQEIQTEDFTLGNQDLQIYVDFLSRESVFSRLIDIYLCLALNRIFDQVPLKLEDEKSPSIEEYELFLSDHPHGNMLDLGLNKEKSVLQKLGIKDKNFWSKLDPFNNDTPNQQANNSADMVPMRQIFDRANCFLIVKFNQTDSTELKKALWDAIKSLSNYQEHFIHGFRKDDFYLIFWENAIALTKMVEAFHNTLKSNKSGLSDLKNYQIVIHTISLIQSDDYRYLYDDLETALATIPFDSDQLNSFPTKNQSNFQLNNQVLISNPLKNLLDLEKEDWLFQPALTVTHPISNDEVKFHMLSFNNDFVKIKKGDIQNLGRFKILNPLRETAFFMSYKAIDNLLERLVVLKILKPDFLLNTNGAKTEQLFLNEARELGKLTHPQIALTYEIGIENNLCFIAREFVEGVPLMKAKAKKSDWLTTLRLVSQIVDVLSFTHQKNIIHGKLKPDNIFKVNQTQEIKLTDFHIPHFNDPLNQQEPDNLKSLTYTAPELIEKGEASTQSDIYSLGVLAYELLSGINPFEDESKQKVLNNIRSKTPPPLTKFNPKLHHDLNEMVMKMVEKSVDARFESMEDLRSKLSNFTENI